MSSRSLGWRRRPRRNNGRPLTGALQRAPRGKVAGRRMGSGERAASGVGLARLISLGRGGLDHFPAVAGGVAETGIDAAEALHRLLDELDAPCL